MATLLFAFFAVWWVVTAALVGFAAWSFAKWLEAEDAWDASWERWQREKLPTLFADKPRR